MFLPARHAGFDVGDDGVRGSEIKDHVNFAQVLRRKSSAGGVVFGICDSDVMLVLGGDFRHQRSGLTAT